MIDLTPATAYLMALSFCLGLAVMGMILTGWQDRRSKRANKFTAPLYVGQPTERRAGR